jgi:carbon storage regulator CsrA
MLVLRRRENESFVIFSGNKEIEVYVTEIDDNSVQIGIEADKDVTVFRREIVDKDNFYLPRASNQQ